MIDRRNFIVNAAAAAAAISLSTGATGAQAQTGYPSRPIKLVHPFSAGTTIDSLARVYADRLQARLGQPVIVDPKPGVGTAIAGSFVAKQPADGYTIFMFASSNVAAAYTMAKPLYDLSKDFTYVAPVVSMPIGLLVSGTVPANNLQELVALIKSKPGEFKYTSYGKQTAGGMWMDRFVNDLGLRATHVPYRDASQLITDLVRGEVHMHFESLASFMQFIDTGKLKVLASAGDKRLEAMPALPTIDTLIPGFNFAPWFALAAPPGLPADLVARLNRESNAVAQDPVFASRMKEMFIRPTPGAPDALKSLVRNDELTFQAAVRSGLIIPQ